MWHWQLSFHSTFTFPQQTDTIRLIWAYHPKDPDADGRAMYHGIHRGSRSIFLLNTFVAVPPNPATTTTMDLTSDKVTTRALLTTPLFMPAVSYHELVELLLRHSEKWNTFLIVLSGSISKQGRPIYLFYFIVLECSREFFTFTTMLLCVVKSISIVRGWVKLDHV